MANKGRGDFGYRNRANRSGLDPVETDAEVGRASGFFITQLLFGKIHTRNPLVVVMLAVFGVLLVIPLALAGYEFFTSGSFPIDGWPFVVISGAIGVCLLINAGKNAIHFRN